MLIHLSRHEQAEERHHENHPVMPLSLHQFGRGQRGSDLLTREWGKETREGS